MKAWQLIVIIMIAVLLFQPGFAMAQTDMYVTPLLTEIEPDNDFNVTIDIDNTMIIQAADFTILFDKDIVTVNSITHGGLMGVGEDIFCAEFNIDNENGRIDYACTGMGPQSNAGGGTFLTIEFHAEWFGTSPVNLSDLIVLDLAVDIVPISVTNGSVQVKSGPVSGVTEIFRCEILSEPGKYKLIQDIFNATFPFGRACIDIVSDDVELDCDGHVIDDANSAKPGIFSNKTNTTIKNCSVQMGGFATGIKIVGSDNSTIVDCDANYQRIGILVESSNNVSIINNSAVDNSFKGILLMHSDMNIIQGNNVTDSYHGIALEDSVLNNVTNNKATDCVAGLYSTQLSSNNTIVENNFSYNTFGLWHADDHDTLIENNIANNNRKYGIYIIRGHDNKIINNTANVNFQHGIILAGTNNNLVSLNTANSNFNLNPKTYPSSGIHLSRSNDNIILDNTANFNKWGIWAGSGNDNNISKNNACYSDAVNGGSDFRCTGSTGIIGTGNFFTSVEACSDNWPIHSTNYFDCPLGAPEDMDSDGIMNLADNCVWKFNSRQVNEDEDTRGDACDVEGDVVFDCSVDIFDLSTVALSIGSTKGTNGYHIDLDLNKDGSVNQLDFSTIDANFGKKCL